MAETSCYFCKLECTHAADRPWAASGEGSVTFYIYSCQRCGQFALHYKMETTATLPDSLVSLSDDDRFRIACVLQERSPAQKKITLGIVPDDYAESVNEGDYSFERWVRVSELRSEFPKPTAMMDRALLRLAALKPNMHPAEEIVMPKDEALFLFFSEEPYFAYMLQRMCESGIIDGEEYWEYEAEQIELHESYKKPGKTGVCMFRGRITPKGWQHLEELREVNVESKQGFIAMWFDKTRHGIRDEGLKAGIEDAGYDAHYVGQGNDFNGDVCDEIIAQIRRSRFVVADFTSGMCNHCEACEKKEGCTDKVRPRGGVYFEAGYAQGLGLEVIFVVDAEQTKQLHFDTRQLNHICYANATDLRQQLKARIERTVGRGPIPCETRTTESERQPNPDAE